MAMGIFAVDDMAGLDVAWRVRQELNQFSEPGARKPLVADTSVRDGTLRTEDRQGLVRLRRRSQAATRPRGARAHRAARRGDGIRRRSFTNEEIIERTIYALINEGARVLEEGYALRAADIDVIYTNGYGFPAWRGGPMFYADRVGLAKIYDRVSAFHRELGQRWAPAPLLARLAKEGIDVQGAGQDAAPAHWLERPRSGCPWNPPPAESGRSTSPQSRRRSAMGPTGSSIYRRRRRSARIPIGITDRLEHWASEAPDRSFLAQRDLTGGWRTLTYADAFDSVGRIAQALLDRKLSPDRPILILSGNGIEHALLALAAMYVGVPYAPIAPAYSLQAREYSTLQQIFERLKPGLVFAAEGAAFERALSRGAAGRRRARGLVIVAGDHRVDTVQSSLLATSGTARSTRRGIASARTPSQRCCSPRDRPGKPKGVINTQRMLCSNQEMIRTVLAFLARRAAGALLTGCRGTTPPAATTTSASCSTTAARSTSTKASRRRRSSTPRCATCARFRARRTSPCRGLYEMLMPHLRSDAVLRETFFSKLKLYFYAAAGLGQRFWDELRDVALDACGEELLIIDRLRRHRDRAVRPDHRRRWTPFAGMIGSARARAWS